VTWSRYRTPRRNNTSHSNQRNHERSQRKEENERKLAEPPFALRNSLRKKGGEISRKRKERKNGERTIARLPNNKERRKKNHQ
jgi:hypothetical protein